MVHFLLLNFCFYEKEDSATLKFFSCLVTIVLLMFASIIFLLYQRHKTYSHLIFNENSKFLKMNIFVTRADLPIKLLF
jgi:hypothetical protein